MKKNFLSFFFNNFYCLCNTEVCTSLCIEVTCTGVLHNPVLFHVIYVLYAIQNEKKV